MTIPAVADSRKDLETYFKGLGLETLVTASTQPEKGVNQLIMDTT